MFTNQALWQERGAFLRQLRRALDANPWLHAVLAIRSDYLANLLPHERDLPGRMLIRCGLESLREQAARESIEMTFRKTDVPLTSAELDLVLDRLLNLDVGMPGSHVRGPIRQPDSAADLLPPLLAGEGGAQSQNEGSASDAISQVLQESDVNLAEYMQSFIDDAVASVAAQTQSDAGIVRRWLEDRLTTPAGRRAVLLVDNEQTAGLPHEIIDVLENVRLIQVEQRNQSPWAELTHDSMVPAVQASNKEWGRTRQRTRLLRIAALAFLLFLLLACFPFLRIPADETLLTAATGTLTGTTQNVSFPPAPPGHVAVVRVSLRGYPGAKTAVRVVSREQGQQQDKELADSPVATDQNGRADTAVKFAINTAQPASYSVIMEAPKMQSEGRYLDYHVTVHSAPVILDLQKPGANDGAEVNSSLVAVKLYPHQPLFLGLYDGANYQRVWGVRTLMTDGTGKSFVLESSWGSYAVLSTSGPADNTQVGGVEEELLKPGPGLYLGAHVNIQGDPDYASINSLNIHQTYAPFGVETSCKDQNGGSSTLLDSHAGSVGSTARSVPAGSVLVPVGHGRKYRLILLEETPANRLKCQVSLRSFAQQRITTMSNSKIMVNIHDSFNAYPVRLPADAVIIVTNLNGARASLDCFSRPHNGVGLGTASGLRPRKA